MKKTGLFKWIMIVILIAAICTWIVPASYWSGTELVKLEWYRVGFFDFFQLGFETFQFSYFIQMIILLLTIGGLYGVLSKTGKYRSLLEKIATKLKGKEKTFLVLIALSLAAVTSVFGYGLIIFIFIPALISIILLMGYDRVIAFMATIGAVLVGEIGATMSSNIVGPINDAFSITTYTTGIYAKLAMFVLAFIALVVFILKAKVTKNTAKSESYVDPFVGEKKANKRPVWPIYTIFALLFVLMVLACTSWETDFGVTAFSKMHTSIMEFSIKGHTIFAYVLGTISQFGDWYYSEMAVTLLLASLLIGKIYKMKMSETLAALVEGAKKMLKPALLLVLAYVVVYIAGNTLFFTSLASHLLDLTKGFNMFTSSIVLIFGSLFHIDLLYIGSYILPYLAGTYQSAISTLAIMTQGLFGIVMFIAPTSSFLILGLTYLEIPYKEWVKKTWKFILTLLLIVLAVIVIYALV